MLKKIATAIVITIGLFPIHGFADSFDSTSDFSKVPTNINLNVRVLDEGKRMVDKLSITLAQSATTCPNLFSSPTSSDDKSTVYSASIPLQQIKYSCLFPMKLKIIDPADSTFPSGIVTLPIPDETTLTSIISQAVSMSQAENMKWNNDPIQKQKYPNGFSVFKVGVDINIDIRADYQTKHLTAYADNPSISIGSYFGQSLQGYSMNDTYNEINVGFAGKWATERITDIHPKDTSAGPTATEGTPGGNSTPTVNNGGSGTGGSQDSFAQKYWQTALLKFATKQEDFNPYANKDQVSFYGKVVSTTHKKMLGQYVVYLEDTTGKMIQKATTLDDGTYFFFPDGLASGAKYNIVVPNASYNTQYTYPYEGKTYPFFQQYGQSIVFEGASKEADIFLSPNVIKDSSQKVIDQSSISAGAKAIVIFTIIIIFFISYKLWGIHQREKRSGQNKM